MGWVQSKFSNGRVNWAWRAQNWVVAVAVEKISRNFQREEEPRLEKGSENAIRILSRAWLQFDVINDSKAVFFYIGKK